MGIQTKKMSEWLAANGQAITNASAVSMKAYMEQNLRSFRMVFTSVRSRRKHGELT